MSIQDGAATEEPAQTAGAGWSQAELEASSAEIMGHIEALRGEEFLRPVAVAVAGPTDFEAYMKEMSAELLPEDLEAAQEAMSKMLALMPADFDVEAATSRMLEGVVGGFYDPFSSTFYLSSLMQPGSEKPILAHELVHALDDQLYDLTAGLRRALGKDRDTFLAYRAVVEGSATNLMNRWMVEHEDKFDMDLLYEISVRSLDGFEGLPAALWGPLVWGYTGGSDFLVKQTGGAGNTKFAPAEDVRRAFVEPPRSTEQVLHPEKYWDPAARDEPIPVAVAVGELPAGWRMRLEDTLGELVLALVTTPAALRDSPVTLVQLAVPPSTTPIASGWGGDRAVLLENEDGDRHLYLATVWDTERDAAEFYGALLTLRSQFEENLSAFLPEEDAMRRSMIGFELHYGDEPRTVILELSHGTTRSTRRKLAQALTPAFGEQ